MLNTNNSANSFSNVPSRASGNSAAPQTESAPQDPQDLLTPVATVTFGEGGISMDQLAKCFSKKADGSATFDFSQIPGVTIVRNEEG